MKLYGLWYAIQAKENRLEYFEALETYAVDGDLKQLTDMIAQLEEQSLDEYIRIAQEQSEQKKDSSITIK